MGPEDHTDEWHKQVKMIVTVAESSSLVTPDEIDRVIMMYAMDETFSRSAILEARRQVLEQ